jgi:Ni/Fe-hydrogenase 1 B-type cytochrome subunit
MWLLLGFVVQHVYSSWLVATIERNGTLDSIFSGNKWIRKEHIDPERTHEEQR